MDVAGRVKQEAVGARSVAAGAPCLLVVVLQRERQVVVGNIAHVGLVDPHAKGVGRHHHAGPVVEEVVLVAFALARREPRVVARGGQPLVPQQFADLLDGAPARTVDDSRAFGPLAAEGYEHAVLLGMPAGALHREEQVGTVEAGEDHERVAQRERLPDVAPHGTGGRGRERHDRRASGEGLQEVDDSLVAWPKVVAPLGDAVRLVHGEQAHAARGDGLREGGVVEPLGRHVDEAQCAGGHAVEHVGALGGPERGVEVACRHAHLAQRAHLVRHERDERGDHDREPVQQ